MPQLATITSKRQLTIPAKTFREAGLQKGQKVLVLKEDDGLRLRPALDLIDDLAGSVDVPKRFKGKTASEVVHQAKKEYFSK